MLIKIIIISLSFCLSVVVPFQTKAANSVFDCDAFAAELNADVSLASLEQKINICKTVQGKCSRPGQYEEILAELYAKNQQYDKAQDVLVQAIKHADYNSSDLEYKLVMLAIKQNNYVVAKVRADKLVKKYPKWQAGLYLLGMVEVNESLQKLQTAKALFHQANKIKINVNALVGLISVCHFTGEHKLVVNYYRQALELDPGAMSRKHKSAFLAVKSALFLQDKTLAKHILTAQRKLDPQITQNYLYKKLAVYVKN